MYKEHLYTDIQNTQHIDEGSEHKQEFSNNINDNNNNNINYKINNSIIYQRHTTFIQIIFFIRQSYILSHYIIHSFYAEIKLPKQISYIVNY